ncbi:MAG TPA: hypothetical protein VGL56_04755 [Fimbriimonadaceae bacterium]
MGTYVGKLSFQKLDYIKPRKGDAEVSKYFSRLAADHAISVLKLKPNGRLEWSVLEAKRGQWHSIAKLGGTWRNPVGAIWLLQDGSPLIKKNGQVLATWDVYNYLVGDTKIRMGCVHPYGVVEYDRIGGYSMSDAEIGRLYKSVDWRFK